MITAQQAAQIAIDGQNKRFKELVEETIPGQAAIGMRLTYARDKLTDDQVKQLTDAGYKVEWTNTNMHRIEW